MLRGIHKASTNWLGKTVLTVVMGLIAVSFAIWGIGDIFRGFGLSTAAKVGGTEISIEQFRNYYSDRLQQIGRRIGRPVTPDQARALGIDKQLIGQLVADTALDEKAKQLRLGVSDAEISKRIMSDPSFKTPGGLFDRQMFEQTIRGAGYTEARYVAEQRQFMLRRQIAETLTGGLNTPNAALTMLDQFRNEQRSIEYILLGPAQAGDIGKPTPEVLSKYFDERKALFRAPEYRKLVLITLSPADQALWTTVSDADAKKYYDENKSRYGKPERRHVFQMVFPNTEEARAAADRIAKGTSFAAVASERGLKDTDIDLGTVEKDAIIDPTVGNAAFALKENEVSQPVTGRFGTVLLQVTKIEAGQTPSYDDVAPQIKRELASNAAKSRIADLYNKIEDTRASGATLAEVAQKLSLPAQTIEAVDRSGRGADNKPVEKLPPGTDVIAAAFNSDVGVENDPVQLPGGGYLWYEVAGVTPSHERKLDEIKSEVETRWRNDEIAARLKTKADDILGKLKDGGNLTEIANTSGGKVDTASALQRGRQTDIVPQKAVELVFRTAKGNAATVEGAKEDQRLVFRVTDVIEPKLDPNAAETKRVADTLRNAMAEDVIGEYIARVEADVGVSINNAGVAQATGAAVPADN